MAILKTLGLSNNLDKKTFRTGLTIGFFAITLLGIILGILFSLNIEKYRIFFYRWYLILIWLPIRYSYF